MTTEFPYEISRRLETLLRLRCGWHPAVVLNEPKIIYRIHDKTADRFRKLFRLFPNEWFEGENWKMVEMLPTTRGGIKIGFMVGSVHVSIHIQGKREEEYHSLVYVRITGPLMSTYIGHGDYEQDWATEEAILKSEDKKSFQDFFEDINRKIDECQ